MKKNKKTQVKDLKRLYSMYVREYDPLHHQPEEVLDFLNKTAEYNFLLAWATWSETTKGHDFWSNINIKWKRF